MGTPHSAEVTGEATNDGKEASSRPDGETGVLDGDGEPSPTGRQLGTYYPPEVRCMK